MKKLSWLVAGIMIMGQPAWAARIQDLSMTPNEMVQQGVNVNRAPVSGTTTTPNFPTTATSTGGMAHLPPIAGVVTGGPSTNYMDGYCDPNFKPLMGRSASYAGIANCLAQQKTDACRLYQSVPQDVKQALDDSINCMAQMSDTAGNATTASVSNCGVTDTRRLALVKRYWNDANLAYALVFVPDLVMDNAGDCLIRR